MPGAATQDAETLCCRWQEPSGSIYSQGLKLLTWDIPLLPFQPGARPLQSTDLSLLLSPQGVLWFDCFSSSMSFPAPEVLEK